MTPVQLKVLAHCHFRTDELPDLDDPMVMEAVTVLRRHKVIEFAPNHHTHFRTYQTTERGLAWIKSLLKISIPTQKAIWVDEKGEAIG